MKIQRLAVIGLGLIGGSVARALRERGVVGAVVAYDSDATQCEAGQALGFVDEIAATAADAVDGADVVLLAVPVAATASVLVELQGRLGADTVLTDVGSTKGSVVADVRAVFGQLPPNFVPAHPIAGTERSGAVNADAGLFVNRRVILTPNGNTDPSALALVTALWSQCQARVVQMGVEQHDRVLAATSHLPHLLAFALVDQLATLDERQEIFANAAGGFRDFTRIASSSPRMWHDIAFANREALVEVLDGFMGELAGLRRSLEQGDGPDVLGRFSRARAARERYLSLIEPSAEASE